jgi:hypothetical protein
MLDRGIVLGAGESIDDNCHSSDEHEELGDEHG